MSDAVTAAVASPSHDGRPPALELQAVRIAFGDHVVLDGMDLVVPRGTNYVIMGRSGTGKSVTLKAISGLVAPTAGQISVGTVRVDGASRNDLRKVRDQLGFVFQGAALINWLTARENVALPLLERGEKPRDVDELVRARLDEVGLLAEADKYPSEMSGGMRKRIGFARATITRPDILLYDEPTTGLDPHTTRTIDTLMTRGRDELGATGVIVSHDTASALRVADRIGILANGRISASFTPDEFRRGDHPLVREFLDGAAPAAAGGPPS